MLFCTKSIENMQLKLLLHLQGANEFGILWFWIIPLLILIKKSTCLCTLLFKSNGILSSNAYSIYRSSLIWSKLLTWHLPGILRWLCEISYTYDYSSRLGDHSESGRFEKRDIKALATGRAFGGYFNIRDRLVWGFKLFLFHGIEMKLTHTFHILMIIRRVWATIQN